ncbi:quinon protein alcohol dehydrogenase-like superfamily [Cladochytrium replicatum]|nr:quinon protein alcohol dehydrogenase-like superfamily [Cladochytrium replicatum]
MARQELKGHASNVSSLLAVNDTLYSASKDKTIKEWDLKTGECIRTLTGHTRWVRSIASDSKQQLYSASWDDTVRCWDLSTGTSEVLESMVITESKSHSLGVNAVHLDEKNNKLYSGSDDCSIAVWNHDTKTQIKVYGGFGVFGAVTALLGSEDGETLFSAADDGGVHVWDTATMEAMDVLTGHTSAVTALALVGNLLYSSSHDGSIIEWDTETAQRLRTFKAHTHEVLSLAVYTPKDDNGEGTILFSGSWDGTVRAWNLSTGECVGLLPAHASRSVNAICTATLSDGTDVLITGGAEGSIKLWNPTDLPKPSTPSVATNYVPPQQHYAPRSAPANAHGPQAVAVAPGVPMVYYTNPVPAPAPYPMYIGGGGGHPQVGGPGGQQICTFFMRGNCRFGASCRNLHPSVV